MLRYHPTILNNDSGLRQTANMQCACASRKQQTKIKMSFDFGMSTMMQIDPYPVNLNRNHDILLINE